VPQAALGFLRRISKLTREVALLLIAIHVYMIPLPNPPHKWEGANE
jgi:hypothetical protein